MTMKKVTLLHDARISYKAGETVEVSDEVYKILVETKAIEPAAAAPKAKKK